MGMCSIINCKNKTSKECSLSFFRFPKNELVAQEWLRLCKPRASVKNGRVCSIHFLPSDYFKSLKHTLLDYTPQKSRQLKPDAVPSVQVGNREDYESDKNESTMESPKHVEICDVISEKVSFKETTNKEECDMAPAKKIGESWEVIKKCGDSKVNVLIPITEYYRLQNTAETYETLKKNLQQIFTPGQMRCFMKPSESRRVKWTREDITAALSLRMVSPKAYSYLRSTGFPLPGMSTLRNWVPDINKECNESEAKEGSLTTEVSIGAEVSVATETSSPSFPDI